MGSVVTGARSSHTGIGNFGKCMSNGSPDTVMERVRRSLRRTGPLASPPVPPKIDEPVARLVHSDIGLAELFVKQASAMKMIATPISVDDLLAAMATFLRESNSKRVMLSDTPLLTRLGVARHLKEQGIDARTWAAT